MEQNQEKITWPHFVKKLKDRTGPSDVSGLHGACASFALTQIHRRYSGPTVIVVDTPNEAERIVDEVRFFSRDCDFPVHSFIPYNISPYRFLAYNNETAAHRIRTLYQIIEGHSKPVVVTTVGAVMYKLPPKQALIDYVELLMVGEEVCLDKLVQKLIAGGYSRAMIVEEPGDFSVRGGIIDIFTPLYDDPVRIELFGETVESIRLFSADTQRTSEELDEAVLLPAREAILPAHRLTPFVGHVRARAAEQGLSVTKVRDIVQRIKNEGIFPGIEGLSPYLFDALDSFFDYMPPGSLWVLNNPAALEREAIRIEAQTTEGYRHACDHQQLCLGPSDLYLSWDDLNNVFATHKPIRLRAIPVMQTPQPDRALCGLSYQAGVQDTMSVRQALQNAKNTERPFAPFIDWLTDHKEAGHACVVVCRHSKHIDRLRQLAAPYGVDFSLIENLSDIIAGQGRIYITQGIVSAGFSWPEASLTLMTDEELFGPASKPRRAKPQSQIAELLTSEDLKLGELVVHADHGIGRYEGLVKLEIDGVVNDFLLVTYKDEDRLYLPVERMHQIQKYMGVDTVAPLLDKMGGKTWERVKAKVKRSAEKIAGQLLKLYASRKVRSGHAYGATDAQFRSFEEEFPFDETPDQLKAIEDVLMDMRQPAPMDRLVCGDVGYGKTEVALRAAFLCVSEAKQAAVLVPTTVLAEQHFTNFKKRFERYPVKVACLNRFRPASEQRAIVEGIKKGVIDIVVGTHRLLQKDIEFRDLGLLILDEEQRFGVRHKEKVKRMRETVDVLTLTATPIPRTLHLSLLGIRDISVIQTPPEQRRPIVTYICELDDGVIADAIRKELSRNGQVFFVHNHVQSIDRMAEHIKTLTPEARLAVAHGQMPEEQLEKVMFDFMNRKIDLLVCTTIIESGLDVASANTILINRADHFGLAQIYQLRGRVGRSDEQAYAYLFIPAESMLTKDAQKRLKVLMEYSDLGSGFQIAMSDLKIRGGGSILGASQSGHIAAVGYDMFLKLMESSIAELKGEPIQETLEPEINIPLPAYLPETYIVDIDQRLSVYRRLARMTDLKAISALKSEMEDRFGRLPDEAGNLLLKIMLKVVAQRAGCKKLDLTERQMNLQFSQTHQARPLGIVAMVTSEPKKYRITPDHGFIATLAPGHPKTMLSQAKNILIEIARHVN